MNPNLQSLQPYPFKKLRQTIAEWLVQRFGLSAVDAERQVLPVNGTREALFAFAQAVVTAGPTATVLCPNPFYQIYEGAALVGLAVAGEAQGSNPGENRIRIALVAELDQCTEAARRVVHCIGNL